MVYRVYVEKKEGFRNEAEALRKDIRDILLVKGLRDIRVLNRYDVEWEPSIGDPGEGDARFREAVRFVLSEPQLDLTYFSLEAAKAGMADIGMAGSGDTAKTGIADPDHVFCVEFLPGQFDQRADSAEQCIQILTQGARPRVRSARLYLLYGELSSGEIDIIKKFVINPVEAREADLSALETLDMPYTIPDDVRSVEGFLTMDEEGLEGFLRANGLAMDLPDIQFCQKYFREEGRNPTMTEIRVADTYWSDHCRHTTFLTTIDRVDFKASEGSPERRRLEEAWARYQDARKEAGREHKPVNLMDLATIAARCLRQRGLLDKLDESEEINACTVKIRAQMDDEEQDWLLLFKNETHNHPTEIEPFGGAATCIGGAIRDPLSGRAYVYHAMRLTGAADPTVPVQETLAGKLPQRKLVTTAAEGYSCYGNQVGLATGLVEEIYHPGYAAKRMEIGAVVAAVKADQVKREKPEAGDVVILLGGRTGRDGIGGATGSSKAHDIRSLDSCGAEVQKGNAPEERKLQRLFRNPEASRMIRRCNDFGAGGVSVAIGELAEGLRVDLDLVPRKYEGLDGTELAISESQERMAVVVSQEDKDRFLALAAAENLEATHVATVTDNRRLVMLWRGKAIVDLSRDFLDSNGAEKHISVIVTTGEDFSPEIRGSFTENYRRLAGDLNVCSQRGLSERFDSTIGAGTLLMPFGGQRQRTPIQAMAARISSERQLTPDASVMSYGFNPYLMEKDPFRGAYLSVVESVCKLVAAGADFSDVYLSFQEYFGKPGRDSSRWGAPLSALLGAFSAQMDLGVAAIGGKDSMSGSFEDMDVPPTLVSFAITTERQEHIMSPEYKGAGHRALWLRPTYRDSIPTKESLLAMFSLISRLNREERLASVYTPVGGGLAEAVLKQCLGNSLGFCFAPSLSKEDIFRPYYGSFLLELWEPETLDRIYQEPGLREAGVIVADLGTVTQEPCIRYNEENIALTELEAIYESRLEDVFPTRVPQEDNYPRGGKDDAPGNGDGENALSAHGTKVDNDLSMPCFSTDAWYAPALSVPEPLVLIPVFPGTNCEYDSAKACLEAGLVPDTFVIRNRTEKDIAESAAEMAERIRKAQIIFIPGGFSGGDEPDGSAKFITAFFRNGAVREATMDLLDRRDGLMLGICNGFQALIKLGLVPFGEIRDADADSPTLGYNLIGRHQSKIVRTRITSNLSPWLMNVQPGELYNVAISHGEGRFICNEELLHSLFEKGQIATQYADPSGNPSMDIDYNPNGSFCAVEGITSADGRILGRMGHAERFRPGNFKNVPGNYDMRMFRSAREYFS